MMGFGGQIIHLDNMVHGLDDTVAYCIVIGSHNSGVISERVEGSDLGLAMHASKTFCGGSEGAMQQSGLVTRANQISGKNGT